MPTEQRYRRGHERPLLGYPRADMRINAALQTYAKEHRGHMPSKDYSDKSGQAYYWLEENVGRVLLVALLAGIALYGLLLEGRTELNLIQRLARGMGPELAGIVLVAVTIDALAERRQAAERRRILISQLGSKYRDITEIALIELRNREWLYDGSLREANLERADMNRALLRRANLSGTLLSGANLSGARLEEANLGGALLGGANLSGALLREANLSGADLSGANLSEAHLWKANLSGANLSGANLNGAYLRRANLGGARLWKTNLSGALLRRANLSGAEFWSTTLLEQVENLEGAIMPDGTQLGFPEVGIAGPSFTDWAGAYLTQNAARDTGQTEP